MLVLRVPPPVRDEWFGKRSFFDQREQSSQAMWMDIALARQSGQELTNHYIITNSPVMAHLCRFFNASVRRLTAAYENIAVAQALNDIHPSICDQMRQEIDNMKEEVDPSEDQAAGGDTRSRGPTSSDERPTPPPVVDTQQPIPGCNGIRPVGGATMPFALS